MESAPISASLATFRWCRLPGERYQRSALPAGPTAWYRWMRCRSFVSRLLLSLQSSGAPLGDRFRSRRDPERIAFMARYSNISGMTCLTPKTGLRTSTTWRNPRSGRMISAVSSAGPYSKTRHFSSFPMRDCGYASHLASRPPFRTLHRGSKRQPRCSHT